MNFRNCSRVLLFSLCIVAVGAAAHAQCTTCYSPVAVTAYQPVTTVQPTVSYVESNSWYLGKWFDEMRWRRAGYAAAPAVYKPVVTNTTTTAYRPVLTGTTSTAYYSAYAPLSSGCSSCTVARPVTISAYYAPLGCSTCSTCSPCSSCSTCDSCSSCSTGGFVTSSGCSSCAAGSAEPSYASPAPSTSVGPQTPQPSLKPVEPAPANSTFAPESEESGVSPSEPVLPGPGESDDANDTSTYLEAPQLFNPQDVSASYRGPSTEVWTAVYRKPVTTPISHSKPTQAEQDASGWYSVPK